MIEILPNHDNMLHNLAMEVGCLTPTERHRIAFHITDASSKSEVSSLFEAHLCHNLVPSLDRWLISSLSYQMAHQHTADMMMMMMMTINDFS